MKNILTDEITFSVKETECYKIYMSVKEKIMKDKELFNRLKEFKKQHIQLQSKKLNDTAVDFAEEVNVSRMYFALMQNELAETYFKSEQELLELVSEMYSILGEQCSELLTEF